MSGKKINKMEKNIRQMDEQKKGCKDMPDMYMTVCKSKDIMSSQTVK